MNNLAVCRSTENPRDFLGDICLTDLLDAQAKARPNDTAVVSEEEFLSYRELVDRSSALAALLQRLGTAREHGVGLFTDPSIDLMVGVWGILYSGAAYLPLSPDYPEERLRHMIEESRTGIVFTQDELRERLTELAPPGTVIVTPRDVEEFTSANPVRNFHTGRPKVGPENLAYVIYTSGSTGKPKGVMIEHRSIVSQLRWLSASCGIDADKVVLQKTPMSFDAAQWELLAPACGSRVVMGAPGIYRDPERLIDTVVANGVTTLQCVPTLLQALLDSERLHECKALTQIFSGGEALSRNLARQCVETLPGCDLVNLYGPTECTINTSAFTVEPGDLGDGPRAISIGSPVPGTEYHILDGRGLPVATGEIGELHISGVQVARGYLHRPDLTADRFTDNPFSADPLHDRLYRTGDLAYRQHDGTVHCAGRVDSQVKLRGYRVELDEIRLAIENHDWVKNAAVLVRSDPRTGFQNLIACVELSPREAALMDQGSHGAHHQSKRSKLQVKAQLSNTGCRDGADIAGKETVDLPGSTPAPDQRQLVFARKTYRFYEGGAVTRDDILRLLAPPAAVARPLDPAALDPAALDLALLGRILRYFGQFHSGERLLPKYGYASPGSLYATQLYLEVDGVPGLAPGFYYHHPVRHQLILIRKKSGQPATGAGVRLHFMGKRRAIEPVYRNNIQEVLEIETGHMLGLFEKVLPDHGLTVRPLDHAPAVRDHLECAEEDYYLGSFELVPHSGDAADEAMDVYVQIHPGKVAGLAAGLYRHADGALEKISDELIAKRHVIAINQRAYERSSFGVAVVSRNPLDWMRYIDLGRKLQHLQMNGLGLGFMSSGYSSRTGNDLPAARRLDGILEGCGARTGPSYFFVGGRVSHSQIRHEGMKEDAVHMHGPAELIREDLFNLLPDYMVPNRIVVMGRLPLTASGKIDLRTLGQSPETDVASADRPFIAPRSRTERRIAAIWRTLMKRDSVSVNDDFFECGGNSLVAVALVNRLNRELGCALPLQVLFTSPTVERLAVAVDGGDTAPAAQLVSLRPTGTGRPIYCWPGLGGYAMNLRPLAAANPVDRPFYGVQAHGINEGETPCPTVGEMAARDVESIRRLQPDGPYTLWGYSFGARVAFEAAYQLEQTGEHVDQLFLIAPGSPSLRGRGRQERYLTILYSVFAGSITGPALEECLRSVTDEESFAHFAERRFPELDPELIRRIIRIVRQTHEFTYTFRELADRRISAPVTIFRARGDDYSFIENSSDYSAAAPTVVGLAGDHYGILKDPGVGELVRAIAPRLGS